MDPAVRSRTAAAPVAPVVGGVVFRAALSGRLGTAGRVTEVSAPPGSGKTLLLRSWIADRAWRGAPRGYKDPARLEDRVWLAIDDAQELASTEALRQLELLVMRAPPQLRFVLATRHDLQLGLHRLRLEGELTEIRSADLRFTLDEARALFDVAGVELPDTGPGHVAARSVKRSFNPNGRWFTRTK